MTSQLAISNKKSRFGPKVASRDWWIERIKIRKPEIRYWTHFTKYQIAQFKALAELDYQVLGEKVKTEGAALLVYLGLEGLQGLQTLDVASSNQGAGLAYHREG